MRFTVDQTNTVFKLADKLGVPAAALLAFIEVESAGVVTVNINGKPHPLIRWEGHYFHRLVPEHLRATAIKKGLAHPKAGGVKNPKDQSGRYTILARAKELDITAAISSASWGIGQVMGAHWKWLGFASAEALETMAFRGFAGQLLIMAKFLQASDIIPHLKRLDWSAVARIYNGPGYAKGGYHTKMAAAYKRHAGVAAPAPTSAGMLRAGSKGARVRELQNLLLRAGYAVRVDGDFGDATERAVRAWQQSAGIDIDGVAGKQTLDSLSRFRRFEDEPGEQKLIEISEVQQGVGGAAAAAGIEAIKEPIDSVAMQLTGVPGVEHIATILTVISAALVIGGLVYAGYGWIKSRRTSTGIEEVMA